MPAANPTGVHRRTVTLPAAWAGQRVVLHVAGAETVLYVHVDGRAVAVGKDSRLPHEVDLTALVSPGAPFELALTVVRWSGAGRTPTRHAAIDDRPLRRHGDPLHTIALA